MKATTTINSTTWNNRVSLYKDHYFMTSGINSVGMTAELLQHALGNEPKEVLIKATEGLGQAAFIYTYHE